MFLVNREMVLELIAFKSDGTANSSFQEINFSNCSLRLLQRSGPFFLGLCVAHAEGIDTVCVCSQTKKKSPKKTPRNEEKISKRKLYIYFLTISLGITVMSGG